MSLLGTHPRMKPLICTKACVKVHGSSPQAATSGDNPNVHPQRPDGHSSPCTAVPGTAHTDTTALLRQTPGETDPKTAERSQLRAAAGLKSRPQAARPKGSIRATRLPCWNCGQASPYGPEPAGAISALQLASAAALRENLPTLSRPTAGGGGRPLHSSEK